jgi:spermidine synthase
MTLFLWSVLGIFSQLAFVRLFSTVCGATAYFGNAFLLLAIFAQAVGFFARRLRPFVPLVPLFVTLAFFLCLGLGRFNLIQTMPLEFQWSSVANLYPKDADFDLQLAILLLAAGLAPVLLLVGSRQGAALCERAFRAAGYVIIAAGGVTGAALFTLQNQLLPELIYMLAAWAVLAGARVAADVRRPLRAALAIAPFLAMLGAGLLYSNARLWSPYQRIDAFLNPSGDRVAVLANGFYMTSIWRLPAAEISRAQRLEVALAFPCIRPGDRVLVLGSGGGTSDVREALHAGARAVTAVEIDATFVELGTFVDPERSYRDPRVRVVIADARRFLGADRGRYDVIWYNFLDSQTNASNQLRFRLDSFLYTVEGVRLAVNRLSDRGTLCLNFVTGTDWIQKRMFDILAEAAGSPPSVYVNPRTMQSLYLLTRDPAVPGALGHLREVTGRFMTSPGLVATDDWPFLYSRLKAVPMEYLRFLAAFALLLATLFLLGDRWSGGGAATAAGGAILAYAFFSGAAFFFIEIRTISALVPVVGSTYLGQSLVVIGIILVSLAGTLAATRQRVLPPGPAWALVFAALLASLLGGTWFHPLTGRLLPSLPLFAATLLLPVFFAGYLFLLYLKPMDSPQVLAMQKWNLIGGALGGLAECLVVYWGFSRSLLLAVAFYAVACLCAIRHRPGGTQPVAGTAETVS